jgi:hypothetical protein
MLLTQYLVAVSLREAHAHRMPKVMYTQARHTSLDACTLLAVC